MQLTLTCRSQPSPMNCGTEVVDVTFVCGARAGALGTIHKEGRAE